MAPSVGVQSSFIGGDGRPLLEPGALFVDGNYALRLNAWCSVAGVTLALRSRFLRSGDGELVDSGDQLTPTSNRALATIDVQLSAGFPLNVQVFAIAGTPIVGQCFVQVHIVAGRGPAAVVLATVLQGYITATQALSWPGSPLQNSLDGAGALRAVSGPVPGVDAEVNVTVPAGARWRLLAWRITLSTSAVAGTRFVAVQVLNSGFLTYTSAPAISVAPSLNVSISIAPTLPVGVDAANGLYTLPAPSEVWLVSNDQFGTFTSGFGAGDQYTSNLYVVREWIDV
jgi:hypothetical protein